MPNVVHKEAATKAAADSAKAEAAKAAAATGNQHQIPSIDPVDVVVKPASVPDTKPGQPAEGVPVEAKVEAPKPPEPDPAPKKGDPKVYRFVKNWATNEPITFKDGSTFRFQASEFRTEDKELADKILAVADKYSIVQ